MIAGTRFRGDFEERLTNLISEAVSAGDVILLSTKYTIWWAQEARRKVLSTRQKY